MLGGLSTVKRVDLPWTGWNLGKAIGMRLKCDIYLSRQEMDYANFLSRL